MKRLQLTRQWIGWFIAALVWSGAISIAFAEGGGAETVRVSVATDGTEGNGPSYSPDISGDARWVVFPSSAGNLVSNDTNNSQDIFLHDRITGETTRVSVASDGTQGNANSDFPAVSGDGRYIAFESIATNLVPNDTNGESDVFVHDRDTGATTRISVASDGTQGNHHSSWADISRDGRFVSFYSIAWNMVPGDSPTPDIYVHDRETGLTTRLSVASDGTPGNDTSEGGALSADGRYVAFESLASNLVISDTNNAMDIFVHDRTTGITTRASIADDGSQSNSASWFADISEQGIVVFESVASNLVAGDNNLRRDIFAHDLTTGSTTRISVNSGGSQGNQESLGAGISANGRFVAFASDATNLVMQDNNGERDIFLHDRNTGETTRISVRSDGSQVNDYSYGASLSDSGRSIVFLSHATDVVPNDTNAVADSFVHQTAGSPSAVTLTAFNSSADVQLHLYFIAGGILIGSVILYTNYLYRKKL